MEGALVLERMLERPQFAIDRGERVELLGDERVAAAPEAVQIEDEPAEVAEAEFADAPQMTQATTEAAAVLEARLGRDGRVHGLEARRSLHGCGSGFGSRTGGPAKACHEASHMRAGADVGACPDCTRRRLR